MLANLMNKKTGDKFFTVGIHLIDANQKIEEKIFRIP